MLIIEDETEGDSRCLWHALVSMTITEDNRSDLSVRYRKSYSRWLKQEVGDDSSPAATSFNEKKI